MNDVRKKMRRLRLLLGARRGKYMTQREAARLCRISEHSYLLAEKHGMLRREVKFKVEAWLKTNMHILQLNKSAFKHTKGSNHVRYQS